MHQISTQNSLTRYAYNETSFLEAVRTQGAIDADPLVEQEFKEIVQVISLLDSVVMEPSKECLDRIMAHC